MEISKTLKKLRRAKVLDVLQHPDSTLKQQSAPVDLADEVDFDLFVKDMIATMRSAEGVGLAAIQVGVPKRVIVFDSSEEQDDARVIVNPRIVSFGAECVSADEGCLSFPGLYAPVERATTVTVEALDGHGAPLTIEAEGLLAVILQHEIDHLNGITFVDRAEPAVRKEALREYFSLGARS